MRHFVTFIFVLLSISLYAQLKNVDFGTESKLERSLRYQKIIGGNQDGFYVLKINEYKQLYIDYISNLTKTTDWSSKIVFPSILGYESKFTDMYYMQGNLIMFLSTKTPRSNYEALYVCYLKEDGTLKNKPIKIGEYLNATEPSIEYSKLQKSFLIRFDPYFSQYNGELFTFKLYDATLKERLSKKLSLPMKERVFSIIDCKIDENKNIYFNIKAEEQSKRRSRTRSKSYENLILAYYNKTNTYKSFTIKLKKYTTTDIIFDFDKSGNIVVAGLYKARNSRNGSLLGGFYKKINPSIQKFVPIKAKTNYKTFDRTFQAEFLNKRNGDNAKDIYNFKLKGIYFFKDDNFVFIAEQYYKNSEIITDPMTKEEIYIHYHHYNDLIVFGVKNKVLNWYYRIPKNQYSINDDGFNSSFYAAMTKYNNLKLVINDHPSNIDETDLDKIKEIKYNKDRYPKGMATLYTIFIDGGKQKEPMFDGNDKVVVPKSLIYKNNDTFYFYQQNKNKYKFGSFYF